MRLVFMVEEPSMKELLEIMLPKILPNDNNTSPSFNIFVSGVKKMCCV